MSAPPDVFQAIADPTRRRIIDLVAQGPLNVGRIAQEFDITRQAVSLHVQLLRDAGLVSIEKRGRQRICKPQLQKLAEVTDWVDEYCRHWDKQFDALEDYLAKLQQNQDKHE